MWKQAWTECVAFVFPARCLGCDQITEEERPLCSVCEPLVDWLDTACPRCARPLSTSSVPCGACQLAPPPFSSTRSLALYGGPIGEALRRLKFGSRPDVAEPLGKLLGRLFVPIDVDLIVPVPLSSERLAERGYNQAQLLSCAMRRRLPLAIRALRRERPTARQAQLPIGARRQNVRGVFVADAKRVRDRCVLLVDDVLTTGETARSCARALLDAGARRVDVLTAARAMP